jgi:hypothetical protein
MSRRGRGSIHGAIEGSVARVNLQIRIVRYAGFVDEIVQGRLCQCLSAPRRERPREKEPPRQALPAAWGEMMLLTQLEFRPVRLAHHAGAP